MQELIGAVGQLSPKERKALAVLLRQKGINLFSVAPIFKRHADEPLLLSYAQERQWFLWQLDPQSSAYNIPMALRLQGELDVEALERSFSALVERHESLRTRFDDSGEQPLQVIEPARPVHLEREQLTDSSDQAIRRLVEAEARRLFDLREGPLLRVKLVRLDEQDHVLVLTQHHSVSDGWSLQILVRELVALYQGLREGRPAALPPLPVQYADYASWQRQWMESGERERQLGYWQQLLGGDQPLLELPLDHSRPAEQRFAGARLAIELAPERAQRLKALAQREGVTLFMLLLASFQALLHRLSGQDDIRVGVPVANRGRVEVEHLIGFFVNTQVMKADIEPGQSFKAFLAQVRQRVLQAQDHQDLPYEQLVEALRPQRTLSHNPLFQVMFNHQSEGQRSGADLQLGALALRTLEWDNDTAQFDLALNTFESEAGLAASMVYATDLFERATVERFAAAWQRLLDAILADPEQPLAGLSLLDDAAREQIVGQWNATATEY
ncbi:condensation domain-containing protein, partial [Pseudomonas sp. GD03858]|uniref:condensation domain-containing protein n=1 Tax=unclassified Pseudomonas TaxID=196821 RepID=UPI00244714D0